MAVVDVGPPPVATAVAAGVAIGVATAVAEAHRREWAFVLAATVRLTRDIDMAEECVQDAYASALKTWPTTGVPAKPGAWLTAVARRRGIDVLRREARFTRALPMLVADEIEPEPDPPDLSGIPDDRLRLICTCCHPALAVESQVALTLRLVCGLSTADVARAFLVSEPTMAARLTRAKKKIAVARIPFRVPSAAELPDRVRGILAVVHLLFTTGHTAPSGDGLLRGDLIDTSLALARMLRDLLPGDGDVAGLLALILLTDARRAARLDELGNLVLLEHQDRRRWDAAAIAEGADVLQEALRARPRGRFGVAAAIAAVHVEAPTAAETDWRQIVGLYGVLLSVWPSPVVALNRAVAVGMADGPAAGLAALDSLDDAAALRGYPYLPAARADFLRRLGRCDEAAAEYGEAIARTANSAERSYLSGRLRDLRAPGDRPAAVSDR